MSSLDLPEGTVLQGRYEIVRQVSRGGMGRIFLARDLRFKGQFRALKQFLPSQSLSPEQRDQAISMFEREAGLLASLRHAHMPGVFDHFIEDGVPYLVMHFVEGETLAAILARSPQGVPERDVLKWAGQLCDILAYLHAQNPPIIFRDLKPSNIMVDTTGAVQLIDFGIARLFQGDSARQSDTVIVGTPGYSPPEQYGLQGQTTPRSDVYALGATLYHLLTGINPALTPFVFAPPRQINATISEGTSQAVMRALENDPSRRFATASDFKQALFTRATVIVPQATQTEPGRASSEYATLADVPPPQAGPPPPAFQYQVQRPPPPPPVAVGYAQPAAAPAPQRGGLRLAFGALVGGVFVVLGLACVAGVIITQFPDLVSGLLPGVAPPIEATAPPTLTSEPQATLEPTATVEGLVVNQQPTDTPAPANTEAPPPASDTPAPAFTPTATPRPTFGQIVFVNDYGAASELYLVPDSGGTPVRLTNNGCADTEPAWSSGGQVAWQSDCDDSMDIWVMNADGSGRFNLTAGSGLSERGPDWSPDAAQLVFEVGNGSDNGELFLMDANGANRRSLGLSGRAPVWSPTGDRIAYMSEIGGRWQVYIYSIEDGSDTPLPCPTQHCRFPEWSPDGNWIAINDLVGGAPKTIYLLEASGDGVRQLTSDGAGNGRPSFSPDGRRIVFNYDGGSGTNGSAIYWMFEDGSSPRLVADLAGDDYQGDWR